MTVGGEAGLTTKIIEANLEQWSSRQKGPSYAQLVNGPRLVYPLLDDNNYRSANLMKLLYVRKNKEYVIKYTTLLCNYYYRCIFNNG